MTKVFIEGASIAGLTAAARLAKAKYEVSITGQIYQNIEIDGYSFDDAPLFTLPAVFRDFFQKTGRHFGQVLECNPSEPAFVFQFPDLTINFANLSHSARIEEIKSKLGDEAAAEWDLLIRNGEMVWERIRENYIEWEFSIFRFNPDSYLRYRTPRIYNPYLLRILGHYPKYFGYPQALYKWTPLVAFAEESFGVWQISGGLGALVSAIKERAIECGAKFQDEKNFDYYIDATENFPRPERRLIGISNFPGQLPVRTVRFHTNGLTSDIYASKMAEGKYSLVVNGKLDIADFDEYIQVDQVIPASSGDADNQLITRIRTSNKRQFKVRHFDSLAHAGITGELLANAVRGIKNRPSHEH